MEFAGDRPPRYDEKNATLTVGRGPVPLPAPDPFVIRRAQTTDRETHIVTMANAGACPPRYDEKKRHHLT